MRILPLILALILAPQIASAATDVAPKTASGIFGEISQARISVGASQLAEPLQENLCSYDGSASGIVIDPINHRDPTGAVSQADSAATIGIITHQPPPVIAQPLATMSECVGAGAMWLTPEPTMTSKVAASVLSAHCADSAAATYRMFTSKQPQTTYTYQAGEAVCGPACGLILDIGVPALAGYAGARSLSPRAGAGAAVDEAFADLAGEEAAAMRAAETRPSQFSPSEPGTPPTASSRPQGTTRLGVTRKNPADWRSARDLWDQTGYGEVLSPENRSRIAAGQTPVVDDAWVRYFQGDAALLGEKIPLHHIGGTPITVPLPKSRHMDAHMPGGFRYNPGGPGTSG